MQLRAICLALCLTAAITGAAQQPLDNKAIVKMKTAGLGDDVIVSAVQTKPGQYSINVDDLIELKQAGVSEKVIQAMITHDAGPTPPSTPSAALPATGNDVVPIVLPAQSAGDKPRVFLQSVSHGTNQNAARDQSMEMSKDFERNCPAVRISLNQALADYTVALNHIEAGFIRDNQFQIADKNGDLIAKTKEGGSISGGVKKVCGVLLADWAAKGH